MAIVKGRVDGAPTSARLGAGEVGENGVLHGAKQPDRALEGEWITLLGCRGLMS